MIAWAIIWFLIVCLTALFIAMEAINGSLPWRFWVCVLLIFVIIIIPVFTISDYRESIRFYDRYQTFYLRISEQELTSAQEYMILGEAVNYNHYLYLYQLKFQRWGIFAPTYHKIKDLQPIQLTNFDMNSYRWWE